MAQKPQLHRHQIADALVLLGLMCLTGWYLWDAFRASTEIPNLILILPVTVLVLLLCLLEFVNQLRHAKREPEQLDPISSVLPVITLFIGYVISLPWLGFDVGTFVFVCLFLWLHGERRLQWTLGYGLLFAALTALFFSAMLPYPMPMLLLPTDY